MNDYIFVVGKNLCGELCSRDKKPIKSLSALNQNNKIVNIYPGARHTIITTQNDQHYGVGSNYRGQCGVGAFDAPLLKPVQINYFKQNNINIQQIFTSAQSYNTVFLTMDQKIYITGDNENNQCGLMDNCDKNINTPHLIQNMKKITSVKQIERHILLLTEQGTVYSTYYNGDSYYQHGQNGFGTISFNDTKKYGFHPIKLLQHKTIIKISAGDSHSLFLDNMNVLWVCGENYYGELGLGHRNNTKDKSVEPNYYFKKNKIMIKDISSGDHHNLILDQKGDVHSFGQNDYGQCGSGRDDKYISTPTLITKSITHKITTIKCGCIHSYFATDSNEHYLFGRNDYNECTLKDYDMETTEIYLPHLINDTFKAITNDKQIIKSVHLGNNCTWIISEPKSKSNPTPIHVPNPDHIHLHKILVLIISVGEYDSDKMHDLNGASTDKTRLSSLFSTHYQYKVISNDNPRVTEDDLIQLLVNAAKEFKRKDINYQGIFVFYSGHGDTNNLLLSDYDGESDGIYDRSKFISYFNGVNVRRKAADYKLFFIDSCRGNQMAQVIPWSQSSSGSGGGTHRGNDEYIHPETNRGIMYGNPDNYKSYEIPYDESSDDIAWDRLTKDNYMNNSGRKHCGIFTNSIYHTFKDNATKYAFSKNYLEIQDMIKEKAAKEVPVKGNYVIKVGQKIENSDTLKGKTKLNMYFMNSSHVKKLDANSQDIGNMDDQKKVVNKDQDDNKYEEKEKKEKVVSKSDPEELLKAWGLKQYIDVLVHDEGWDDPENWTDEVIDFDYLKSIGFKPGHARKFMRKAEELYQ